MSAFSMVEPADNRVQRLGRPSTDIAESTSCRPEELNGDNPAPAPIDNGSLFLNWWSEIVCVVIVFAATAMIGFILTWSNGKALTAWPLTYFSLNTSLSILVLVVRTLLSVTITCSMAQLKWSQFYGSTRTLWAFTKVFDASTSPMGCVKLILPDLKDTTILKKRMKIVPTLRWQIPFWHLASISSVLFLLTYGLGPVVQQSVETRTRSTPTMTDKTFVPVFDKSFFPEMHIPGGASASTLVVPKWTLEVIYLGIFGIRTTKSIPITCSSGNCKYEPYQSLAFCNTCVNVTDQITRHKSYNGPSVDQTQCSGTMNGNASCVYKLPNGLTANWLTGINTSTTLPIFRPELLASPPLVNLSVFLGPYTDDHPIQAAQCALSFCAMRYNSTYMDGIFTESSTPLNMSISPANFGGWNVSKVTLTPKSCIRNNTDAKGCNYTISGPTGSAFQNSLQGILQGNGSYPMYSSDLISVMALYGPEQLMDSTAAALTKYLRLGDDFFKSGQAPGMVQGSEVYYYINWWLLIYPGAVVLTSAFTFVVIMFKTRKEHIWKDSALPLLFAAAQLDLGGPSLEIMKMEQEELKLNLDPTGHLVRQKNEEHESGWSDTS